MRMPQPGDKFTLKVDADTTEMSQAIKLMQEELAKEKQFRALQKQLTKEDEGALLKLMAQSLGQQNDERRYNPALPTILCKVEGGTVNWSPQHQHASRTLQRADESGLFHGVGGILNTPRRVREFIENLARSELVALEYALSPASIHESPRKLVVRMLVRTELRQRERDDEEFVRASLGVQSDDPIKTDYDNPPFGGQTARRMWEHLTETHYDYHHLRGEIRDDEPLLQEKSGTTYCRACCWSYRRNAARLKCVKGHSDCQSLWNYATIDAPF